MTDIFFGIILCMNIFNTGILIWLIVLNVGGTGLRGTRKKLEARVPGEPPRRQGPPEKRFRARDYPEVPMS
jgi:hypothetical protein